MKAIFRIFNLVALLFCFLGAAAQTTFSENFDSGLPAIAGSSDLTLTSGTWTRIGSQSAENPSNARGGTGDAVMITQTEGNHITSPLLEGATSFSFWYKTTGGEGFLGMVGSTDGSTFNVTIQSNIDVTNTSYIQYSHNFETPFTGYIRLKQNQFSGATIYIDDFDASLETASSITVTSPTANTNWNYFGSTPLTWTSEGIPGTVNIKLSTDGGSTFPTTIVSGTANDGSHSWTYSNPTTWSSQSVVRIEDASNASVYDDSEIFNFAPIAIYAPAAAATLQPGAGSNNIIIQFGSYSFGSVDIEYSTNGGSTWTNFQNDYTACLGGTCPFSWTVPDIYTEEALIRVTSANGGWVVSSGEFKINGTPAIPTITLTAPNGAETWQAGTEQNITWTTENIAPTDALEIYLSTDGGATYPTVILDNTTFGDHSGSYTWTVTDNASATAKIKVVNTTANPDVEDVSNAVFTIIDPTISLTYPTVNTAVLRTGQIRNITWTSEDVANVNIRYSQDGGNVDWVTIVNNVDASLGTYAWTVPTESLSNDIVVEVADASDAADPALSAEFKIYPAHDLHFSETFDEAPETLFSQGYQWNGRIWFFNGSSTTTDEDIAGDGKAALIPNNSWLQTPYITDPNKIRLFVKSSGTSNVTIQKSIGEGQFANVNQVPLPVTSATYTQIEVDPELTGSIQFRILVSGDDLYVDDLEVLAAPPAPTVTLTAPNGAEEWQVGTEQNITWTTENVAPTDALEIYLSTDGGSTYPTVILDNTTFGDHSGSYTWTVTDNVSATAKIKVVNTTANPDVADESDAAFAIIDPTIALTYPTSATDVLRTGQIRNITWTSEDIADVNIRYSQDGGNVDWVTIANNVDASLGTYAWTVPSESLSNSIVVEVADAGGLAAPALSTEFKIYPALESYFSESFDDEADISTVGTESLSSGDWYFNDAVVNNSHDVAGGGKGLTIPRSPAGSVKTPAIVNPGTIKFFVKVPSGTAVVTLKKYVDGGAAENILANIPITGSSFVAFSQQVDIAGSVVFELVHSGLTDGDLVLDEFEVTEFIPPVVTITSPTSASAWELGTIKQITWESEGIDQVSGENGGVNLYYNVGAGDVLIADNIASSTGANSYDWLVAGSVTATAQIKIEADQDVASFDLSDEFSILTAPAIAITSPTGSEEKKFGQTINIVWNNNGTYSTNDLFQLFYRNDAGTWTNFYNNYGYTLSPSGNQMSYNWTIPDFGQDTESQIEVKVVNSSRSSVEGISNAFRVYYEPSVAIVAPTGTEEKKFGQTQTITWDNGDYSANDLFYLYYSKDGAAEVAIIANYGYTFSASGDDYSYNWAIPDFGTDNESDVTVRVYNSTRNVTATSEAFRVYYEPSVSIVVPAGTEEKKFGQTQTITWDNGDYTTSDLFYLYYSKDGAAEVQITANYGYTFSASGDDYSYNWTIPDFGTDNESDVTIRVYNSTRNVTATSEAFRVYYEPSVSIVTPVGTEEKKFGQTQTITWDNGDYTTSDLFYLYYSKDGAAEVQITANYGYTFSASGDDYSYNWTIPDFGTDNESDVTIRVYNSTRNVTATSEGFRVYYEPSVSIVTPAGTEEKKFGQTQTITWANGDDTTSDLFYLYYSKDGATEVQITGNYGYTFSASGDNYSYNWTIPDFGTDNESQVTVRVYNSTRNVTATSESFRVFYEPQIDIIYPAGGEAFPQSTVKTITWDNGDAGTSDLYYFYYSLNNGAFQQITALYGYQITASGSQKSYNWSVPVIASTNVKFKVVNSTRNVEDTSQPFTVCSVCAPVTLAYPNGGESAEVDQSMNIRWSLANSWANTDQVVISYNTGGSDVNIFSGQYQSVSGNSYSWTIPDAVSDEVKVKITNTTTSQSDESNGFFSIVPIPARAVEFSSPSGDLVYLGSPLTIEFTAGEVGPADLLSFELSTNGGVTFPFVIETGALNSFSNIGDFYFFDFTPNNALYVSESCVVRAKFGSTVIGTSDEFFIASPSLANLAITFPQEGEDVLIYDLEADVTFFNDGVSTADLYKVVPGQSPVLIEGDIDLALYDDGSGNITYPFTADFVAESAKLRIVANGINYETGVFDVVYPVTLTDVASDPISLLDFGIVQAGGALVKQYQLNVANVGLTITSTNPDEFEISLSAGSGFTNTLPISAQSGVRSIPVYVRYDPATNNGALVQGTLTHAFTDSDLNSINVDLNVKGRAASAGPSMVIFAPETGDELVSNSVTTIRWGSTSVSLLKVQYSINGGTTWNLIEDDLSSSFTEFDWLVPDVNSATDAIIRLVDQSAGATTVTSEISILPAPKITALSLINSNEDLQITGSGFSSVANQNQIIFPGFPDITTYPSSASSTQLVVEVPAAAVTGFIKVIVSDKGTAISPGQLTLSGITISPEQGQVGNTIFINGSGVDFQAASDISVIFNNGFLGSVEATEVTVDSDDMLSVVVPQGVEENGNIEVDLDGTVYTSAQTFKIQSFDFTPKTAGIFETFTISGVNTTFLNNNTQVFINGLATTETVVSNTQINVTVPQGASTGKVTISTNDAFYESSEDLKVDMHRITSLSATKIAKGQSFTISGDNFSGATSVKVNGVSITFSYYYFGNPYFTINSDQQITVNISPSSIQGTGKVSVTKGGVEVESAEDLTVIPAITSMSTTQGAPGSQITLYGSYFSNVDNTVYFNQNKPAAIVSQNASVITVVVPDGAIDGTVRVVNNDVSQEGVSTTSFDVVAAPVFTSFSPLKAAGGSQVTITGQNFQNPAPTAVKLNGTSVSHTVVDNNTITFTVPSSMYGAGKIEVTKGGVTVEGAQQFTILPKIDSYSLSTGAVEGAGIYIYGSGFNPTASNNQVVFHSNKQATITAGSNTYLYVTVPVGAVTGKLKVTNQSIFETAESVNDFIVVPKASISSFTPTSGQVTKTLVTITGQNFSSPNLTTLRFNGTSASFTVVSDTEVTATVPFIFSSGPITFDRAGETVTSANSFEIAPDITSLSATTLAPGASLTVSGTYLSSVSEVKIGTTVAQITSNTNYYGVTVTVPAMTPGTYKVTVSKNGLVDESDAEVTIVAAHTITNFTQVANVNSDITVTGTNFTEPAISAVTINGVNATVQSATATQLVVRVPANMNYSGQGKIGITRAGLNVQSTSDFYVRHGISTAFNTQNYIVDQQITISGNNFYYPTVSEVTVNGVSASFYLSSDNALVVTIPNAVGTGKVRVIKPSPVGTVESSTDITIVPRAVLSEFSPTIQSVGSTITITGQNFTNPSVSSVVINNTAVSSFTVNSATQITATVPSINSFYTQGNVQITRGGLSQSLGTFTVKHTVSSLSTTTVTAGAPVTVYGSYFTSPSATITLGGVAVSVSSISATSLTFTVPANATPGTNELVLTRLGSSVSAGNITVLAPHTIVALDSDRKDKNGTLTITGTNFDNSPQVYLNGSLVSATVNSNTEISLTVPSYLTGGTVNLSIARGGLTVSSFSGTNGNFTGTAKFYMKPSVSTNVAAAPYVIGQTVALTGSNFGTPSVNSVVLINGSDETIIQSSVLSDNSLQIVLTRQSGATLTARSYDVKIVKTVTSAEGNIEVTLPNQLTIDDQATITGITEASAPAGSFVTITGTGFTAPSVTSVTLNGASVGTGNFTITDDNTLSAKVPSGATAYANGATNNITIVRGGLSVNAMDAFTVEHSISGFLNSSFVTINASTERVVEGQTIYVEGSHFESFASITSMTVNGIAVTPTYINGNRLRIVVPSGSQGVGKVVVVRRGITVESAQALMISPAATLTSVDPDARIAGATITLSGDHFTLPDVTAVTINGASSTFDVVNDDNIKVTIPSNATATGNVTVTRGGVVSNTLPFKVIPKIISFTNTGLHGSTISITGTHFGSSTGTNQVFFTGASGFVSATISSANSNSATVTVPAGAITGPIKVTNTTSAQSAVSSSNFNLLPAPGNFAIDPASGPVATQLTITGTNMVGVNEVTINSVAATSFIVDPDGTNITVTVPSSATSGNVVIKKAGQSFTAGTFSVTPKIISFPGLAVVGGQITINGKTFTSASSVKINNVATTINQVSSDFVKVTPVAGNVGVSNIVVTTPSGSGTSSSTIEIKGQPAIASFSPTSGSTLDVVTITGSNLSTVTFVKFNNVTASFTISSDTQLSAIVPSGASTGKISLGLGGITVQSVNDFGVLPKITTFTASATTGTTVQVNGTNFTGATQVSFNGAVATPTSVTSSSLQVVVPAAATTGPLTVTTVSGTSPATTTNFVVVPAINTIDGIVPVKGVIGSTITIAGTGFIGSTASSNTIYFTGGVSAVASAATSTTLTVDVPAGAITGPLSVTVNGTVAGPLSSGSFTIVPQIALDGLSVESAYPGDILIISGSGFNATAANNTVNFGGNVSASPYSASSTSLSVNVPQGFATGAVSVATGGETSEVSTQTLVRKSVTVKAPNGNKTYNIGDTYAVTWTTTGMSGTEEVEISYSSNGGTSYEVLDDQSARGSVKLLNELNGTYAWVPAGPETKKGRIKVSVDGGKVSDESNANFAVRIKPLITVLYPNGGEIVRYGKPAEIEFATEGLADNTPLLFEYSLDSGATYDSLGLGTIDTLAGKFNLALPELYSNKAILRITAQNAEAASDSSDAVFTHLPKPILSITKPEAGERVYVGESYQVEWTSEYLLDDDSLELFYSTDSLATFVSMGSSTAGELGGMQSVTIDSTLSENAFFKVVNADNQVSASSQRFSAVYRPGITLLNPVGEETYFVGDDVSISFSTLGIADTTLLVVSYSLDSLATFTVIDSLTIAEASGSVLWSLDEVASDGFVMVRTADSTVVTINATPFTILPAPAISLQSPAGGEVWYVGDAQEIEWTTLSIGDTTQLVVEFSSNNGQSYEELIRADAGELAGAYSWVIPNSLTEEGIIRVRTSDSEVMAINQLAFSILPAPAITLLSPQGGETWYVGDTRTVTWTTTSISEDTELVIGFSADGGNSYAELTRGTVGELSGSFDWLVPDALTSSAKVMVRTADSTLVSVNETVFAIQPTPSISLLTPEGGEEWLVGEVKDIIWSTTSIANGRRLVVEFSSDNGQSYEELIRANAGELAGTYSWMIPNSLTEKGVIRVRTSDSEVMAMNQLAFSILPAPAITLLSPQGGETWYVGDIRTVTWTTTSISEDTELVIGFSADGGNLYEELTRGTVGELSGSFDWLVPDVLTSSAKVMVRTADSTLVSVNETGVAIQPAPSISLLTPAGGEVWLAGETREIEWSTTSIAGDIEMVIAFSSDGGVLYTEVTRATVAELAGTFAWMVPDVVTEQGMIMVRTADSTLVSVNEAGFSILPAPSISLTSPAGGEVLLGGESIEILWTTTSIAEDVSLVVEFSADGAGTFEQLATGTVAELGGVFIWTVPNSATSTGFVRVRTTDSSLGDINETAFVIQAQATSLTISGLLRTPGGTAVNVAEVLLYKANPAGGWDIVATDNLLLSQGRNRFSFADLQPANYLVFAKPDRIRFPNLRNTWFGNTLLVKDAVTIALATNRDDLNIQVVEVPPAPAGRGVVRGVLVNTSGTGRVSGLYIGRILDDGAPLVGVTVNLLDNATGDFVADAETDDNGMFEMRGLLVGQYRLSVELAGVPMDFGSAVINLENENDDIALTAAVSEDGVIVVTIDEIVAGVNDPLVIERMVAYPMPAENEVTLEMTNRKSGVIKLVIFDLAGQPVFTSPDLKANTGDNQWTFDLSALRNGMYMGKFVEAGSGRILPYQLKVMISK